MLAIAQVSPAHGRTSNCAFSHELLRVVGRSDGAIGNFVGSKWTRSSEREGCLKKDVGLVPVDVVVDVDLIGIFIHANRLNKTRALPAYA